MGGDEGSAVGIVQYGILVGSMHASNPNFGLRICDFGF
jgi:hypothetical protein